MHIGSYPSLTIRSRDGKTVTGATTVLIRAGAQNASARGVVITNLSASYSVYLRFVNTTGGNTNANTLPSLVATLDPASANLEQRPDIILPVSSQIYLEHPSDVAIYASNSAAGAVDSYVGIIEVDHA